MRNWPEITIPKYKRAVFLDRDGTINVDTHYPHLIEELEMIPGSTKGLEVLAKLPLEIIVISNQAGIALEIFTIEQMSEFNTQLRHTISAAGGRIDAIYFCPHLESKHLPPEAKACDCSKPSPGMLLEAAKDFMLDLSKCFVIGDKTSDIAAGERVGCKTILLETGKAGAEEGALQVDPKFHAGDLYKAALLIKSFIDDEKKSSSSA